MYYLVKFDTTCENCGKKYSGYMGRRCPTNDSSVLGDTLNSMADGVDAQLTRKKVESSIRNHDFKSIEVNPQTCFACGTYQSWFPPVKPVKPEPNKVTVKGAILSTFVVSIFVVPACLILFLILILFIDDFLGDFGVLYVIGFAFVISVFLGIRLCKDNILSDEEYQKEVKQYETDKQRYDEIELALKNRTVQNLPQINLSWGTFTNSDPYSALQKGIETPQRTAGNVCLNCHKKLHGVVGISSVELARARTHCCPWCGEKLPDDITLNVETDRK